MLAQAHPKLIAPCLTFGRHRGRRHRHRENRRLGSPLHESRRPTLPCPRAEKFLVLPPKLYPPKGPERVPGAVARSATYPRENRGSGAEAAQTGRAAIVVIAIEKCRTSREVRSRLKKIP